MLSVISTLQHLIYVRNATGMAKLNSHLYTCPPSLKSTQPDRLNLETSYLSSFTLLHELEKFQYQDLLSCIAYLPIFHLHYIIFFLC